MFLCSRKGSNILFKERIYMRACHHEHVVHGKNRLHEAVFLLRKVTFRSEQLAEARGLFPARRNHSKSL